MAWAELWNTFQDKYSEFDTGVKGLGRHRDGRVWSVYLKFIL